MMEVVMAVYQIFMLILAVLFLLVIAVGIAYAVYTIILVTKFMFLTSWYEYKSSLAYEKERILREKGMVKAE